MPSATSPSTAAADPRGPAPQAPVLDDACVRQRPARANRAERELAEPLRLGRARRVEDRRRQHPLGQVVEALEALASGRRRARRGSTAGRASASPASSPTSRPCGPRRRSAASRVARARGSRRARARARWGCVLSTSPYQRRPPTSIARAEERPVVGGQEAGLVRPVLDQPTACRAGARRCRAGSGRSVRRARSGGSARRPRSSRAARTRAGGRPPRPRVACRAAPAPRSPARRRRGGERLRRGCSCAAPAVFYLPSVDRPACHASRRCDDS